MIKVGIIGLGINGSMHLRGFSKHDDCRVAAVCDIDMELCKAAARILPDNKLLIFTDYKKMLKEAALDAVAVCTPTFQHTPIALAAIEKGLDVLLEKPIAPTIKETDEVIKKAFDAGRVVQVGLVYRHSNLFRTLAQMTEAGTFGNVMMAYCKEYRDNFPTQWFFETKKSGGALLDKNCHHFDLFSWFIKSRPERVFAMGGQHVVKGKKYKLNCSYAPDPEAIIHNPDIVDHAFVLVEYENSAKANLSLCMYQVEPGEGLEIGIIGDNGTHALAKKDLCLSAGGGHLGEIEEVPVDYFSDNLGFGHIGVHIQHRDFLDCVKERRLPFANLLLARESMAVCLAAERSIVEQRTVLLSEFSNPHIEKLIKKHSRELAVSSPKPLPPPPRRIVKELTPQEELLKTIKTMLKMLLTPAKKGKFKEFNPEVFEKAADTLNADGKYLELARGLNARVAFEHPGKSPALVEFRDGHLFPVPFKEAHAEVTVKFTSEGWKELFGASSAQRLVMQRKIILTGRVAALATYTEAMLRVADKLKSI